MQVQTLRQWLREHSPEERESLAAACKTSVPYLYQLAGGHRTPSLRLSLLIEQHTGGSVTASSFIEADAA